MGEYSIARWDGCAAEPGRYGISHQARREDGSFSVRPVDRMCLARSDGSSAERAARAHSDPKLKTMPAARADDAGFSRAYHDPSVHSIPSLLTFPSCLIPPGVGMLWHYHPYGARKTVSIITELENSLNHHSFFFLFAP